MEIDVRQVLGRYPPEARSQAVTPLGTAGGLSGANFWKVPSASGVLVLRRWPKEHPQPDRLWWIHTVLRHVSRRDVTYVPVPLETLDHKTLVVHQGHLWELAPWMPGVADFHRRPSSARLAAAMGALARFHVASQQIAQAAAVGPAPAMVERHRRLCVLRDEGLRELRSGVEPTVAPTLAPLAERFLGVTRQRLAGAIDQLAPLVARNYPLQPCIRDVWHDHVLFTENEVTGLIDFGAMRIDTPATDVARLLGSLAGNDAQHWNAGLEAYDRVRHFSGDERRAVRALDLAGTLIGGCNWVRWIFVERREFESLDVVRERLSVLLARLSKSSPHRSA